MPKKRAKKVSILTHGHKHVRKHTSRLKKLGKAHSKAHANKG